MYAQTCSKKYPPPPRSMDADGLPFLYLRVNILLGDKRGFVLQVMVDVIRCHHTVNNTDITVQLDCLYVPDLQLPPHRSKQQLKCSLENTGASAQICKITLSSEWNLERTIPSGLNGVAERNRRQPHGGFVEAWWFRHRTRIKNLKTPHRSLWSFHWLLIL